MFSEKRLTRLSPQWLLLVLTMGLAFAVALVFASQAKAAKNFNFFQRTSVIAQSGFAGDLDTSTLLADSPYTYANTNDFVQLDGLSVTLTMFDGDTGLVGFDRNELTLGLDGIDTGIKLNGFRSDRMDRRTIVGVPDNAAEILAALKEDGELEATVINTSPDDFNFVAIPSNRNISLVLFGKKN